MGDEEYTAAAATAGGQVYTWGYGDVGQLGHGLGYVPVGIDNVGQRVMVRRRPCERWRVSTP